jgi:hypothetical protein
MSSYRRCQANTQYHGYFGINRDLLSRRKALRSSFSVGPSRSPHPSTENRVVPGLPTLARAEISPVTRGKPPSAPPSTNRWFGRPAGPARYPRSLRYVVAYCNASAGASLSGALFWKAVLRISSEWKFTGILNLAAFARIEEQASRGSVRLDTLLERQAVLADRRKRVVVARDDHSGIEELHRP